MAVSTEGVQAWSGDVSNGVLCALQQIVLLGYLDAPRSDPLGDWARLGLVAAEDSVRPSPNPPRQPSNGDGRLPAVQGRSPVPVEGAELAETVRREFSARGLPWRYWYDVVMCESGGRWDAVGAQGELGPAQLHPQGKLLTFYAEGYTDPFGPEAIRFMAEQVAIGEAWAWACAR